MFDRNGDRKYLNASERKAYRQTVEGEEDALRKAFLLTLFHTGCRISEGLNMRVCRIDIAANALVLETLKQRKKGRFRAVPVPEMLVKLLRDLAEGKEPEARLWEYSRATAYRMIKAKMREANIIGGMACPKGLRHSHAVACVASEIPLPTIKKWLGHARLETTALYLDVRGEEERELAKRLW